MTNSHAEFRLLLEGQEPRVVKLPARAVWLGRGADTLAVHEISRGGDGFVLVEPVVLPRLKEKALACLLPTDSTNQVSLTVNGQTVPRLCVWRERDRVRAFGLSFYVTRFLTPNIQAASSVQGKQCAVCHTSVTTGDAYICDACGATLHLNGELDCAHAVARCPACNAHPITLSPGYTFLPEGMEELEALET